ncbi:MAG: hypothetical protein D6781_09145 [Verrucomicrobia bacterium]|nr:MAG: hypothetical protein D6781_09145 [Verrucomicrobiota bacterium]
MDFVIGIDGGGTRTRAWLTSLDGRVVSRGEAGGSNVHQKGVEASCRMLVEAVAMARTRASRSGVQLNARPRAVFAGVAGAGAVRDQRALEAALAPALLCHQENCTVDHDLRIALAGGLGGAPGLVIVAGTGSACYGRVSEGLSWKAGGWGPAVDDLGSGYWLGVESMRAVVQAADGRRMPTPLSDAVLTALGATTPREMIDRFRDATRSGMDRAVASALAPTVIGAAESGDHAALEILRRGAEALAAMATAVVERLAVDAPRLEQGVTAGGLLETEGFYFRLVREAVGRVLPGFALSAVRLPPVAGAVLLALEQALGALPAAVTENVAAAASGAAEPA